MGSITNGYVRTGRMVSLVGDRGFGRYVRSDEISTNVLTLTKQPAMIEK